MKDHFLFPAFVFTIGVAALFFIVVSGNAAVPDCAGTGVCSWVIKDDYSQVYRGLVVNSYGASTGLIVQNGNVGIGTASPASLLTVGSGDLFQVTSFGYVLGPAGTAGNPTFSFTGDPDTGMYNDTVAHILKFAINGINKATIDVSGIATNALAVNTNAGIYLSGFGGNRWISGQAFGGVVIQSGSGNGLTVRDGGNVGVGITSPVYLLELATNSAAKPTSNVWTISSDQRIKTDVQDFTKGLSTVLGIRPRTYKYNGRGGSGYNDTDTHIGIVAQELEHP